MEYEDEIFLEQEAAALADSLRRGYRAVARGRMSGWLKMYNRGTHQTLVHSCPILQVQYDGIRGETIEITDQLSGGWRQVSRGLRDGGKITCSVYIETDAGGKLYRQALMGAMLDQSIERFRLEVANPQSLGFTALEVNSFVFVGSNLGLSQTPVTKVDLEISGEVFYLED